ncbi:MULTISPECIES: hypothetical protein [Rhizobium]|jgi:hypothetical protein|uniref:hypothetical protein n=1 Tax=Rhizobium TaxID=379 RepID=UPI0013DE4573|nr:MULTISPECIES: hypothetical protein [Rhizobium]UWU37000.1 hypothetical protein N2597_20270 [Rhizobium leguminosarum bv. phaseoli]
MSDEAMTGILTDAGFSMPGFPLNRLGSPANRIENTHVSASEDTAKGAKAGSARNADA